jgi:hypothetical protein
VDLGALGSVGYKLGRAIVCSILEDDGIEPAPERGKGLPWLVFLKAHWRVLTSSDFFAARIYENSYRRRQIKFDLLELSQRHRLNPSVLRFARFGEPRINVLRCFAQCRSCGTRRKRSKSVHNPAACSAIRHRSRNLLVVPVGRAWSIVGNGHRGGDQLHSRPRALRPGYPFQDRDRI